MKNQKAPVLLEMPVPEKSFPYLVGNHKKGEAPLRWVETPSNRNTILSWGISCSIQEIVDCMLNLTKERALKEQWGSVQIYEAQGKAHMSRLGIEETTLIKGEILVPTDPSLLGSILIIGTQKYPLIHNPSRGICFIQGDKKNG